MRILFIGTVEFSRETLAHLLARGHEVVGICTLPRSDFNADHVDLTPIGQRHGIPVRHGGDLDSPAALAWIAALQPDVAFCFGWSKLLKPALLALPRLGVVGYHPAALPANRGRHPIVWALALGLEETASTFFFMDEGADTGDLVSQQRVPIGPEDDARTLYDRLTATALAQLDDFVPRLAAGTHERLSQPEGPTNSWRKRGRPDGVIDWRMSARAIHNLVRALARPYVGAEFEGPTGPIKVWKTRVVSGVSRNLEPGKVLKALDGHPVVKAGEDAVCLLETTPPFDPAPGGYV